MKKYIEKTAAIIIEGKKLLLVSANNKSFFWTPGGKIEAGENPDQALTREIKEELGVKINDAKFYFAYLSEKEEDNSKRKVYCYMIDYDGQIVISAEIDRMMWLSKEDFVNNKYNIQIGVNDHLIPKLIEDKLL